MSAAKHSRDRLAKPLAMGLAILWLVFFLQIAAHGHSDGWQDGACRLCQLAHVGMAPALAAATLATPLEVVGEVTIEVSVATRQDCSSQSSPRAPPCSNA